ncbi:MAG: GNAT family N-acetyltransferase [Verrucomicrobiota bacterium]|jgi:GNAT superfamily N-acetyltransferase
MRIYVEQATATDAKTVSDILLEAAAWLRQRNLPMWRDNELVPEIIAADIADGLFFLGKCNSEVAGVIKFQLEDRKFWPDVVDGESAFVHRLAVRRRFAGGEVSNQLLRWAVHRTRNLKRHFLRLDCESSRPKLRAFYERFGFRHHSDLAVPPYFVSRYEYEIPSA